MRGIFLIAINNEIDDETKTWELAIYKAKWYLKKYWETKDKYEITAISDFIKRYDEGERSGSLLGAIESYQYI